MSKRKKLLGLLMAAGLSVGMSVTPVMAETTSILDEITEDFEVDIDEMIDMAIFETDKVDEIEELDYLEDHIINMDMLLQKELMTLVPMQILCKDDCKGLCKVCGANLNHETCDCDDFVPDPRLSVFANILKG